MKNAWAVRVWALVALLACGCWSAAHAQAAQFTCPVRLQPQGARLVEGVTAGFSPAFQAGTVAYLLGVSVFEGPPAEGAEVQPASATATQLQWQLEGQRRAYVVCRYEGGIGLSRAVDTRLRHCTATLRRSDGRSGVESWGLERAAVACE